jgi:hypothetical protein
MVAALVDALRWVSAERKFSRGRCKPASST